MPIETPRQCWAYDQRGQRCQKTPNHRGLHEVRHTWDDTQCFTPGKAHPNPPTYVPPPMSVPDPAPASVPKCVACGHMHKGGECKCGCHEHIA